ncbi:concanavalin A-like lectin/glucanase domain-containing protein [Mycena metata]|uniref:Endo-1,4-beta-xylanase n=1 Tax=Mycena metata TaxID=1033252 RepID=A0AAD7HZQ7_9AGAR|nr:concanavalin A-like lectin/glucanase domain-containing protein [Mycena metata]
MNFLSCLLVFLATAAAAAVSDLLKHDARSGTASISGTNFGYYYTFSAEDGDAVTYTNLDDSDYSIQWKENSGYFIGGKGWNPGSAESVFSTPQVFIASPDGTSSSSIYGWSTDPLVEYRIVESLASAIDPVLGLTLQGTVNSDGSVYNIYKSQRVNATSIMGTSTFSQYWSIRQSARTNGFVTIANHFNAWATVGMPLGELGYQIVATEGHGGSGSVEVYIGSKPAGPPTQLTSGRVQCVAEYGQCGGQGYTGATCCVTDTTCVVSNQFFSHCMA